STACAAMARGAPGPGRTVAAGSPLCSEAWRRAWSLDHLAALGGAPDLPGHAHARACRARVVGDLAGGRRDSATVEQLGLRLVPADADGQVGRADASLRSCREEPLHAPVFERVERNPCKSTIALEHVPRQWKRSIDLRELVVDDDPQRLEDALGRMAAAEPRRRRHRADDRLDEVVGGLNRAVADDRARDLTCVALLAEVTEGARQLPRLPRVDDLACAELLVGVHAHVQRRLVRVRESALARVD